MSKQTIFAVSFFTLVVITFFSPFFIHGKLPIPADTIVGLYHPYRDWYAKVYPRGIPYKNFLITDPVRQQFPWRRLAITQMGALHLPIWNQYTLAGGPLLANIQNAALYPLNILFVGISFEYAWSVLVFLQPLLAGLFLYLYLRNLRIHPLGSLLGAFSYAFSGFMVAWMEWNTIGHTAVWLPLLLLSVDRVFMQKGFRWYVLYILSLTASFFAGHLQTFFYVALIQTAYVFVRWLQQGRNIKRMLLFIICLMIVALLSAIQWVPALQYISLSARDLDLNWHTIGWFIPWQHLIQFIAPDFFGNPATLNYWGTWNYGELVGYIGIFPLLMALYAILFRKDKKTYLFSIFLLVALLFALPTPLAAIPFLYNVPFFSSAQPTRLLFIICFSLAILSSLGLDLFIKEKNKKHIVIAISIFAAIILIVWGVILNQGKPFTVSLENIQVAKRNFYLPTLIFLSATIILLSQYVVKQKKFFQFSIIALLLLTSFDLIRFANKFTPFTDSGYLFPATRVTTFLNQHVGNYRILTTDPRILPPNFSIMYNIQTLNGYDPLYGKEYAELIAASERGEANIELPFGFHRIIVPQRYDSKIIDILGVKYILSLTTITAPKLEKVFQEGTTQIYENKQVLPRVFFVERVHLLSRKQDIIARIFDNTFDPEKEALVEADNINVPQMGWEKGKAMITSYTDNIVVVETDNAGDGFLVLTDTYYPTWRATIDKRETGIFKTDYILRGVNVPKGKHTVTFYTNLF